MTREYDGLITDPMTGLPAGQLAHGFDAAYCPDPLPFDYTWCMVYAGGSSAARPDGWTSDELARVEHLPRLPVWVPTPGSDNPRQAAMQFRQWLRDHGVPTAQENGGQHVRVLWDLETGKEPDPQWVTIAADYLHQDYFNLIYGSPSWLFRQPRRAGYMVADPDGIPLLYPHAGGVGKQYAWNVPTPGGPVDANVLLAGVRQRLWQPAARTTP
jgi:hypothetical protein